MASWIMVFMAVGVGTLIPLQTAFNARLGTSVHSLQASLISFIGGTLFLLIANCIARTPFSQLKNLSNFPWYYCTGGVLGALFVTVALSIVPQIGVATMLMSGLMGQLLMSALIDHFGLFGSQEFALHPLRVVGFLLILVGVFCVSRPGVTI